MKLYYDSIDPLVDDAIVFNDGKDTKSGFFDFYKDVIYNDMLKQMFYENIISQKSFMEHNHNTIPMSIEIKVDKDPYDADINPKNFILYDEVNIGKKIEETIYWKNLKFGIPDEKK